MEFLKQIVEHADKIEQAQLYDEIAYYLNETFNTCVAIVLEAEGTNNTVATQVCLCMMKDKMEQEQETVIVAEDVQSDVDLLASLKPDTIEEVYDTITESFDACVDKVLKKDKNLKKEGKNGTRKKAAQAICAVSWRKQQAKD